MLSKGLRDEEKEKVSEVFNRLLEMPFVPELWESQQKQQVSKKLKEILDLALGEIETISNEEFCLRIKEANLEFNQYEQFGDLLLKTAEVEEEENISFLAERAGAVYQLAQQESKNLLIYFNAEN
ncbi:hypothetical protein LZ575_13815 [Antarcticibacterium sp. 1MA-6-2]|uniref:hypothetical protein n=1 Tax=Antarcticibacterium sp. 1MA-6-2 TaxID=2908210 RepID=UPI001F25E014|nr:hypothetical protein [Antarcticibacterium sp. 1MA-6-2]UJH90014.1 hypothetical protein LZ575_13815 [Antarcticibacterium sp. 1MA-6-2]